MRDARGRGCSPPPPRCAAERKPRLARRGVRSAQALSLLLAVLPFAAHGQPAQPTGLSATPGDASATLEWTDPSDSTITAYAYSYATSTAAFSGASPPLAALTALEDLSLTGNLVADLSPLSRLTRLERLRLGGNQIEDISPLGGLASLTRLWLNGNGVTSLAPLPRLGDALGVRRNPLSAASLDHVETLRGCTTILW